MLKEFIKKTKIYRAELMSKIIQEVKDLKGLNNWSHKDLLAHIYWYEKETLQVLQQRALIASSEEADKLWNTPLNKRNELIREIYLTESFERLLNGSNFVFNEIITILEEIDNKAFNEDIGFDLPDGFHLKTILNGNLLKHYRDHLGLLD